ncbi:MAG: hypothetical protein ACI92S_001084, partial [Planctomycetaceae bacterium]
PSDYADYCVDRCGDKWGNVEESGVAGDEWL